VTRVPSICAASVWESLLTGSSLQHRELEEHFVRAEPLGHDRDMRAYYIFSGDNRVFIEETFYSKVHPLPRGLGGSDGG
jgi:hypothetical protein